MTFNLSFVIDILAFFQFWRLFGLLFEKMGDFTLLRLLTIFFYLREFLPGQKCYFVKWLIFSTSVNLSDLRYVSFEIRQRKTWPRFWFQSLFNQKSRFYQLCSQSWTNMWKLGKNCYQKQNGLNYKFSCNWVFNLSNWQKVQLSTDL